MTQNEKAIDILFNMAKHLVFENDKVPAVTKDCRINSILMRNMVRIGDIDLENDQDVNSLQAIIQCGRMDQLIETQLFRKIHLKASKLLSPYG